MTGRDRVILGRLAASLIAASAPAWLLPGDSLLRFIAISQSLLGLSLLARWLNPGRQFCGWVPTDHWKWLSAYVGAVAVCVGGMLCAQISFQGPLRAVPFWVVIVAVIMMARAIRAGSFRKQSGYVEAPLAYAITMWHPAVWTLASGAKSFWMLAALALGIGAMLVAQMRGGSGMIERWWHWGCWWASAACAMVHMAQLP